jgi:outer membrane cobalamin receptor
VLGAASPAVRAQAASPDAPAADDAQRIEITVNMRRETWREKQREAAGTVSALQGDALEASGATGMEDMFRRTPGVQTHQGQQGRARSLGADHPRHRHRCGCERLRPGAPSTSPG